MLQIHLPTGRVVTSATTLSRDYPRKKRLDGKKKRAFEEIKRDKQMAMILYNSIINKDSKV